MVLKNKELTKKRRERPRFEELSEHRSRDSKDVNYSNWLGGGERAMRTGTFDDVTKIVVSLNRITGVRTFNRSNTWFWLALSILYKAILMPCFLYSVYVNGFQEFLQQESVSTYMMSATYVIMTIVAYLSTFIIQVFGWRYYEEMSLLSKDIAQVEQSLMKLNAAIDYRNIYTWIVAICVINALNGFAYCMYYVYALNVLGVEMTNVLSDALLNIMIYTGGMVVLDFTLHVCWLERSFKQTNDLLRKFFIEDCTIKMEDWNNEMVASWLQRCLNEWRIGHFVCRNKVAPFSGTRIVERQLCTLDKINILQRIRYIHLKLCTITKLLNKIFDTQIMFHSIVAIHNFVTNLYIAYVNYLTLNAQSTTSMLTWSFYVTNGFYTWLRVAALCYFCEKTAKEAKQIVQIIHMCSIHNSDIELKHELIQFSLQVSLAEIDHKNSHLFWLNDIFILQSLGGMVTYFLIMIQWSEALGVFGLSSNLTTFNQSY